MEKSPMRVLSVRHVCTPTYPIRNPDGTHGIALATKNPRCPCDLLQGPKCHRPFSCYKDHRLPVPCALCNGVTDPTSLVGDSRQLYALPPGTTGTATHLSVWRLPGLRWIRPFVQVAKAASCSYNTQLDPGHWPFVAATFVSLGRCRIQRRIY